MGRLKELIDYYERHVEDLARSWGIITKHMECGEIRQHREYCQREEDILKALKELQHYKDLEEQGRLIELPCAVGDTVWMIIDNRDYKRRMKGYYPPAEELPALSITETKFDLLCLACMGRTIFLTKEEAGAKLKELENGKKENNKGRT